MPATGTRIYDCENKKNVTASNNSYVPIHKAVHLIQNIQVAKQSTFLVVTKEPVNLVLDFVHSS